MRRVKMFHIAFNVKCENECKEKSNVIRLGVVWLTLGRGHPHPAGARPVLEKGNRPAKETVRDRAR